MVLLYTAGTGVVIAKDTPNFIANRIGVFSILNTMRAVQEMDLTVEEVDALTGTLIGWPRSATFRTLDMVGLDVLGHVVANMADGGHTATFRIFSRKYTRQWLGDKTGGGFYKKIKGGEGKEDERLALNWKHWNIVLCKGQNFPPSKWRKMPNRPQRG